jgi:mannosyltransferase
MAIHRKSATAERLPAILALLILVVAMGLRFNRLDVQSFWNDEGNTARLVERPLALIIEGAAGDIHPPGYYLILHGWRLVAGQSEFALRAYSALCGLMTVAVTIALGRRAGGGRAGLIAGLFVAIHPLAVYYSQEARMYAQLGLVTALTLQAASALVRAAERPFRRRLETAATTLSLAACIAVGLYTQYTYVLALMGLNLAFALRWFVQRPWRWRVWARWGLAHALGGILFLPWAPVALGAAGWQPPDLNQSNAITALARTLVAGPPPLQPAQRIGLLLAGGLLLLGGVVALAASPTGRRTFTGWAALSIAVVPAMMIAGAGIYRPAYLKFLIVSVAPLALTWSLPLSWHAPRKDHRRRLLKAAGLLAALYIGGVQAILLARLYHDPDLARDDYRGIAAQVRVQGRPGDAVLLNAPNQWEVFTYYYGSNPEDVLPVYTAPYRPTEDQATTWVTDILDNHRGGRLFVLFWGDGESDPERHIERALARAAFKAGERWVTTIRWADYGVGPVEPLTTAAIEARLGEGILLTHYGLPSTDQLPGRIVPLKLIWQAREGIEERLKVFVHLITREGDLVSQVDMEPQAGLAPTTIWEPGERIPDRYGLSLPPDLAPGAYTVLIGMYRMSGERLTITMDNVDVGDALPLGEIVVRPGP